MPPTTTKLHVNLNNPQKIKTLKNLLFGLACHFAGMLACNCSLSVTVIYES
jgi:hypothetical protein